MLCINNFYNYKKFPTEVFIYVQSLTVYWLFQSNKNKATVEMAKMA